MKKLPYALVQGGIEQGKGTVTIKIRPGALRVIAAKRGQGLESPPKDEGIPVLAQNEVNPVLAEQSRFKREAQDEVEKMPVPDPITEKSASGE